MYDWHLVPHKKPASAGYGALPALAGAALLARGCAWLRLWDVIVVYFFETEVVTGVFCQSAIDSAQNDHAAIVQSILENKDIAV